MSDVEIRLVDSRRDRKAFIQLPHAVFAHDAAWIAHSTTMALLGRNVCYSGKKMTWDEIKNSDEKIVPDPIDINASLPIRPMRIPGVPETQA